MRNCIQKSTSDLERADELTELSCSNEIDGLEGLDAFYAIDSLVFERGIGSGTLESISALTQLRELKIRNGSSTFSDLSPLSHLFELRALGIQESQNVDSDAYRALSQLRNLESLETTNLSDYSMLAYFPELLVWCFPEIERGIIRRSVSWKFLTAPALYDNEFPLESSAWLNSLTNLIR